MVETLSPKTHPCTANIASFHRTATNSPKYPFLPFNVVGQCFECGPYSETTLKGGRCVCVGGGLEYFCRHIGVWSGLGLTAWRAMKDNQWKERVTVWQVRLGVCNWGQFLTRWSGDNGNPLIRVKTEDWVLSHRDNVFIFFMEFPPLLVKKQEEWELWGHTWLEILKLYSYSYLKEAERNTWDRSVGGKNPVVDRHTQKIHVITSMWINSHRPYGIRTKLWLSKTKRWKQLVQLQIMPRILIWGFKRI